MGNLEEGLRWFDQATADRKTSKDCLEDGNYYASAFFAQQSAEKAVKAIFQKMGSEAWRHSVADLLTELSKKHQVQEELINVALELDKVYIPARYPNAHPSGSPRSRYTPDEARRLIAHAEKIIKV